MRIGFVATRLAGVDSVNLEAAKWVGVLQAAGHEVFFCAGELDASGPPGMPVPEMHILHPGLFDIQRRAFGGTESVPGLADEIKRKAEALKVPLLAFIDNFKLDLLIVPNALSIPLNIPLGVALYAVIESTGIPAVAHHHTFFWEHDRFWVHNIPSILREVFPPVLPSLQHVVISSVMQRELEVRHGIEAMYIPCVFDFEHPPTLPDAYSRGWRKDMGFAPRDVVLLQPTRLLASMAVERGLDLVRLLGSSRYKFVVTGYGLDEPGPYFEWLLDEAVRAGVETFFIGERLDSQRREEDEQRIYTLADIYPQADLVIYLSRQESFGAPVIETLYYRRPLVVNTYPVYRADIKPTGVQAIEIDEIVTPATALEVLDLLYEPGRRADMTDHNYEIGLAHFSYRVLRECLVQVLARATGAA